MWKTEQSPVTNKSPHQVPHPSASKVGWATSGRSSQCRQSCFLGTLPSSVWCWWWWWCARDHSSLQLVFRVHTEQGAECHGLTSDATTFCSHLSLPLLPPSSVPSQNPLFLPRSAFSTLLPHEFHYPATLFLEIASSLLKTLFLIF